MFVCWKSAIAMNVSRMLKLYLCPEKELCKSVQWKESWLYGLECGRP